MDKRIKESFDQIHAPKSLVDDTINKIHAEQRGETIENNKKQRNLKPIIRVVTAFAACVALVFAVTNMAGDGIMGNNNSNTQDDMTNIADLSGKEDSLNAGDSNAAEENLFDSTKGVAEWKQVLENLKENENEIINLEDDYVIYTTTYESDGKEYRLDILLKDGCLYPKDIVIVQGQFEARVFLGNDVVRTGLDITSTSQFSEAGANLILEDINEDGQMDFLLETMCDNDGTKTEVWYTLDSAGEVREIKM